MACGCVPPSSAMASRQLHRRERCFPLSELKPVQCKDLGGKLGDTDYKGIGILPCVDPTVKNTGVGNGYECAGNWTVIDFSFFNILESQVLWLWILPEEILITQQEISVIVLIRLVTSCYSGAARILCIVIMEAQCTSRDKNTNNGITLELFIPTSQESTFSSTIATAKLLPSTSFTFSLGCPLKKSSPFSKSATVNPSDHHRPNSYRPHQPQVPLGFVRLRSQVRKSETKMLTLKK
ncbi:ribosomal protein L11 methyltransferase [Striga asiatica]|uniref:Ribosomal protein L11 methyltransferase n=1 Tax=Striga asiatica TaxID=4170 RepID=A0A5A7R9X5_STRAF|nr:ribosomal protein L11 methyltransferase [Striga asiatica]